MDEAFLADQKSQSQGVANQDSNTAIELFSVP